MEDVKIDAATELETISTDGTPELEVEAESRANRGAGKRNNGRVG